MFLLKIFAAAVVVGLGIMFNQEQDQPQRILPYLLSIKEMDEVLNTIEASIAHLPQPLGYTADIANEVANECRSKHLFLGEVHAEMLDRWIGDAIRFHAWNRELEELWTQKKM